MSTGRKCGAVPSVSANEECRDVGAFEMRFPQDTLDSSEGGDKCRVISESVLKICALKLVTGELPSIPSIVRLVEGANHEAPNQNPAVLKVQECVKNGRARHGLPCDVGRARQLEMVESRPGPKRHLKLNVWFSVRQAWWLDCSGQISVRHVRLGATVDFQKIGIVVVTGGLPLEACSDRPECIAKQVRFALASCGNQDKRFVRAVHEYGNAATPGHSEEDRFTKGGQRHARFLVATSHLSSRVLASSSEPNIAIAV